MTRSSSGRLSDSFIEGSRAQPGRGRGRAGPGRAGQGAGGRGQGAGGRGQRADRCRFWQVLRILVLPAAMCLKQVSACVCIFVYMCMCMLAVLACLGMLCGAPGMILLA